MAQGGVEVRFGACVQIFAIDYCKGKPGRRSKEEEVEVERGLLETETKQVKVEGRGGEGGDTTAAAGIHTNKKREFCVHSLRRVQRR